MGESFDEGGIRCAVCANCLRGLFSPEVAGCDCGETGAFIPAKDTATGACSYFVDVDTLANDGQMKGK